MYQQSCVVSLREWRPILCHVNRCTCKLGLFSCCRQNPHLHLYICNCFSSGCVDWTAPCHRRTCVDPEGFCGTPETEKLLLSTSICLSGMFNILFAPMKILYCNSEVVLLWIVFPERKHCILFPLCYQVNCRPGVLPQPHTYVCSASASLHLYMQLGSCWLAWTTTTTSTDQPREKMMVQFSMLYYKYSHAF